MTRRPEGNLLVAVETSGPVGSVALARDGEVLGQVFLEGRSTHAARLIPALDRLTAGRARSEIGGVVVGSGPGSFTGVRVAAATAKGLAHALGVPLWAVSSLEAAAVAEMVPSAADGPWAPPADPKPLPDPDEVAVPSHAAGAEPPERYVLFDARADRVYAGCYRLGERGPEVIQPPRATRVAEVLAAPGSPGLRFVGDGAVRHRETLAAGGASVLPPPAGMPTAAGLVHVLTARAHLPPVEDPGRWGPDYLRGSGAERRRGS